MMIRRGYNFCVFWTPSSSITEITALKYNITITAKHISGETNKTPDSISRLRAPGQMLRLSINLHNFYRPQLHPTYFLLNHVIPFTLCKGPVKTRCEIIVQSNSCIHMYALKKVRRFTLAEHTLCYNGVEHGTSVLFKVRLMSVEQILYFLSVQRAK